MVFALVSKLMMLIKTPWRLLILGDLNLENVEIFWSPATFFFRVAEWIRWILQGGWRIDPWISYENIWKSSLVMYQNWFPIHQIDFHGFPTFPIEWPSTRVCHPPSQWGLPEFFAMSTEFQQSSNRDKMATQAEMRMVKLTRNDITELGHPENQRSGSMLDLRWFLGHMHDDCCMEWLYDGSNFLKTASWRRRIDMTCKKHDLPSGNQT